MGIEWDGDENFEPMWEQEKWVMVESPREVCASVREGGKNPKNVWWSNKEKAGYLEVGIGT